MACSWVWACNAKVSAVTSVLAKTQWGCRPEVPDKDLGWKENHKTLNSDSCYTVQWLSCVRLFVTPWTPPHQASLFFTISQSLLKPMSIELVMPANYLIPCCFLRHLPSIFPSVRVFSNESALHIRWPKDWSFSTSPSSDYLGLMSFRIDWFDLLAVQGSVRLCLGKMRLNWSPVWQAGWSHVNFAEQNCIYQNSLHWIIPA